MARRLPSRWRLRERDSEAALFLGRLLEATSLTATVPYGLAPNHTYKEAFTFLAPLYGSLVERHGAENLVLMGDSAGGGLALAFAQALLEKRFPFPRPRCIVLIFPWLDITLSNPDIAPVVPADLVLQVPGLREAGRMWPEEMIRAFPR